MLRSSLCTAGALLICSSAIAQQQDARPLLRPIPGNLRQVSYQLDQNGVAHRVANGINLSGLEVVYDNTCPTGYFLAASTAAQTGGTENMEVGDFGGLPATTYAGNGNCAVGCADTYDIEDLDFAYCTNDGVAIDLELNFKGAPGGGGYHSCVAGGGPALTDVAAASITITGLPRSSAAGGTAGACYGINLNLGTPGFTLNGGTSFPVGSIMGDRFSYSMQVLNGIGNAGPVLSGNLLSGTCAMCDGTIWNLGGQSTNSGRGLGNDDHFWINTFGGAPANGGCYFFGGNPTSSFFLTLRDTKPCAPPSTSFCDGSDGALASCPCSNPGLPDTGCDNAQATGGVKINVIAQTTSPNSATLTGTNFSVMGAATALIIRSPDIDVASPVVFGDGLRCVSTTALTRLAATTASAGTSTHVLSHASMAGTGDFFYQVWYRNTPSTFCDPFAAFNLSNGEVLIW